MVSRSFRFRRAVKLLAVPRPPVLDREVQYGIRSGGAVFLNRMFYLHERGRSLKKKVFCTLIDIAMAELAGLPIPTMDWHSLDAPQAFNKFKARCELYFFGPLKEKSEEEQ